MPSAFIKRVKNYVFKERLFSKGDSIVVGLSGGPDSVALVRVLAAMKKNYALKLKLVHVNYGLRGQESEKDELFVRQLAKKLDWPLVVYQYSRAAKSEEALRKFRYDIFEKEREAERFDWIAVAHQKDDQVETFLLNLLRGSGLKGLGAMRPKRDRIIRPLLGFTREEILSFLKESKQTYRVDHTNFEINYLRNRIRNKLLPVLAKDFNPAIRERIFDLAENIRIDHALVEEIGQKAYNKYVRKNAGQLSLDSQRAQSEPPAVLRWLFRQAISQLDDDRNLTLAQFREFEKIVRSEKAKEKRMKLKGVLISRKGKDIIFKKEH